MQGVTPSSPTDIHVTPDGLGPIGTFLYEMGVPYAVFLGPLLTFLLTFACLYAVSRIIALPLLHQRFHVRRRIAIGVLVFLSTIFAATFAGYGPLTGPTPILIALFLAFGFAFQDYLTILILTDSSQRE